MDERYRTMNEALKTAYRNWFSEIKEKMPFFLDEKYSNPYYCCVPQGWIDSPVRILIVGEEGFGFWGRGKEDGVMPDDISAGQTCCWSSLASYLEYHLEYDLYPDAEKYGKQNTPFWQRARKLAKDGVCAWTNIDLFHLRANKGGKCALSQKERRQLHSTDSRILAEQIEILQPTHVVYAGWYGISLQHELPELFYKLYPGGLGDSTVWKKKVVTFCQNSIYHIFAYHPYWGIRQKGYEDWVLSEFKKTL